MAGGRDAHTEAMLRDKLPELLAFPNGEYVQWVIATPAGHPYLHAVIARVLRNIDSYSPLRFGIAGGGTLRVTGPVACSLAIEGIRDRHPHLGPMSALDRDFVYSGLAPGLDHRKVFGAGVYYYHLRRPIVQTSALSGLLADGLGRLAGMQVVARAAGKLRVGRFARRVRAWMNGGGLP